MKSEYRKQLESQPCKCVSCGACGGSGQVEYDTGSYPEWDLESCYECDGSGTTECCQRCEDLAELDREEDWQERA